MPGFARRSRTDVPALGVAVETWVHPCGTLHVHLANLDPHRAFAVAFRTPPGDDSGLPHILEHTALCGSARFPVRDPFFKMLRRSLQTFMNAMTFADMTCYPFASQVTRDFDNLLDIYLDAVFRPLLDPLDFAQEGHRLETAATGWERKGVVFNEMKGAMDGTEPQLEAAIARTLLPGTCFRWNSGGEPAAIPRLTHEDLVAFHRRCYVPANACFATYGALDVASFHARLEPYLIAPGVALPPAATQAPLNLEATIDVPVPLAAGQDPSEATAAALTWAVGDGADLATVLDLELLDRLLLGHAGAPLRLALEASSVGRSIGASGLHTSFRTLLFSAELDGIEPADYPRFAPLVHDALAHCAVRGFATDEIAAALDQLELARREISGDHYPFGLDLCLRAIYAWNHGADPLPFLDQSAALAALRRRAGRPGWAAERVRDLLIENPHRVLAFARPDADFHHHAEAAERAALSGETAAFDDAAREKLTAAAAELARRQAAPEDVTSLPELGLADVPRERPWATGGERGGVHAFVTGTNGVLHQLVAIPLPALSADELDLLPLLTHAIGNVGVAGRGYAEQAAYLNARCGGLWAWTDLACDPDDAARTHAWLLIECKGLATRHADCAPLIAETLDRQRHDELPRLAELIDQELQRLQERVASHGTRFAVAAAARGLGGPAAFSHRMHGFERLAWLKRVAGGEDGPDDADLAALGAGLDRLLGRLRSQPRTVAMVGDAAGRDEALAAIRAAHAGRLGTVDSALSAPAPMAVEPIAFTTATAVQYNALVHAAPALSHADAPALAVAAQYLSHGYLHQHVREQGGAYGGNARYSPASGMFVLDSYRDPRLAATFADFAAGLRWLQAIPDDERPLREAILAVIAGVDTPASPAGEAKARFIAERKRSGPERINPFRAAVLAVTPAEVRAAATRWLAGPGHAASVASAEAVAAAAMPGWQVEAL